MIQDTEGCTEDYEYFSRPENMQELRQNLLELVQQDRHGLQELINCLQAQIASFMTEQASSYNSPCQSCPRLSQMASTISMELSQRCLSLSSIGHLAIKLIDFVGYSSLRHAEEVEQYVGQVDRLQNAVEEMTYRNTHIENDVMIFREQLEAARQELEQIAEEREEQVMCYQEKQAAQRDHKIQTLQRELEKMQSQLAYFKVSALSRASFNHQHSLLEKNTPQTSSLPLLQKTPNKSWLSDKVEQQMVLKFSSHNRDLEQENQRLRKEIDAMKKSAVRFMQEEDILKNSTIDQDSRPLLRVRTSTKIIQMQPSSPSHHSPFDFNQFLTIFKSKRQERLNKLTQNCEELQHPSLAKQSSFLQLQAEPMARHTLNSQWSKSSLGIQNAMPLQSQLVLLTQYSQQPAASVDKENCDIYFRNAEIEMQNKETQSSIKQSFSQMPTLASSGRSFSSIGINTLSSPVKQLQRQTIKEEKQGQLLGSRIMKKIAGSSLVSSLTNFVVNNRVKRRSREANSGTATILI